MVKEGTYLHTTYKATKTMDDFHWSDAIVKGVRGPVGCIAGNSLVVTEHGLIPISDLNRPVRVLSWNEKACRFELSLSSGSFPKGRDYLYRVTTLQGKFDAAGHHLVFCAGNKYRQVESLSPGQFLSLCSDTHYLTTFSETSWSQEWCDP